MAPPTTAVPGVGEIPGCTCPRVSLYQLCTASALVTRCFSGALASDCFSKHPGPTTAVTTVNIPGCACSNKHSIRPAGRYAANSGLLHALWAMQKCVETTHLSCSHLVYLSISYTCGRSPLPRRLLLHLLWPQASVERCPTHWLPCRLFLSRPQSARTQV
jgi:hypothetical protein